MKNRKTFEAGEAIEVTFSKSQHGNLPIGRTDSGMICLLDRRGPTKIPFVEVDSSWICEVTQVDERKLWVRPHECFMSAAANRARLMSLLPQIVTKHPEKHKPIKGGSKFMSITERRKAYGS